MRASFDDIFTAFDGPAQVGRVLGVTTEHAVQMRRRGSIPPEHWGKLVAAANDRGLPWVTHEFLLAARVSKPSRQGEAA